MKGIITVDIGTTSVRAVLFDPSGNTVHIEQRSNVPDYLSNGEVEQAPEVWRKILPDILKSCSGYAAAKGIAPICISVTAQRSSVIPVDRDGAPLHPAIMWQDKRTAGLASAMATHNATVYRKTGLKISPVFSAIKMTWLRRHRPDILRDTHKLIGIQDWALFLLTGCFVTDHSFGSRTNLLNLATKSWDAELLALFEVDPEMLCELVPPGSVVGGLLPSVAAHAGLPDGLPVVTAGGDQQCAALGLGLFGAGRAVANTGTGSYLIGHSDAPVFDDEMRLACNVSAVPGAYIVEAATLMSGSIYRWFNECVVQSDGNGSAPAFDELNAEAALSPPGAHGLIMLPHFKGSGAPHWDMEAKGVFYDLTLGTTRGDMLRAIQEGIAIDLKASLESIEHLCGRIETVSVSGGMTKSDLFNQIQSDVFDRSVVRFTNNEATSRGAWIAGSVAMGEDTGYPQAFARAMGQGSSVSYRPDPGNRHVYDRQCRRARALYDALATPSFREAMK